jgi:hypothetical protein
MVWRATALNKGNVRAELANEFRVVQFAGSKTTRVIGFFR